jgi:hypothetical protein
VRSSTGRLRRAVRRASDSRPDVLVWARCQHNCLIGHDAPANRATSRTSRACFPYLGLRAGAPDGSPLRVEHAEQFPRCANATTPEKPWERWRAGGRRWAVGAAGWGSSRGSTRRQVPSGGLARDDGVCDDGDRGDERDGEAVGPHAARRRPGLPACTPECARSAAAPYERLGAENSIWAVTWVFASRGGGREDRRRVVRL